MAHEIVRGEHARTITSMLSPILSENEPLTSSSTSSASNHLMRASSADHSPNDQHHTQHDTTVPANAARVLSPPISSPLALASTSSSSTVTGSVESTTSLLDPSPIPSSHRTQTQTPVLAAATIPTLSSPDFATAHALVGPNQTISSINSYSSAALSSGTFTAISVSPIPSDISTNSTGSTSTPPTNRSIGFGTKNNNITVDLVSLPPSDSVTPHSSELTHLLTQHVAHLSISTPSDGTITSSAQTTPATHLIERQISSVSGNRVGDTPSMVRMHEEDGTTPAGSPLYPQESMSVAATASAPAPSTFSSHVAPTIAPTSSAASVAFPSLLSPSFPIHSAANGVRSPDSPHSNDSPLPPVVSALMAAQKLSGALPGATLSVPANSGSARLLFVCGDASGAGKSCVAMGILHLLIKRGYQPNELAYIKPCTQCEDVQMVSKFCEKKGIAHQGLGPVIFYEGFTQEVIDGKAESVEKRRSRIQKAVNKIADGKKWVIVDGVGYAGVGSVAGVSNAEVASLLNAPVLVVGRPGIGNAIDSMNFIMAYFEKYHVHLIGACWNRIPPMVSYHTYEACKTYVNKYFREVRNGIISPYGHIPLCVNKPTAPSAAEEVVCRLREAKTDLEITPEEEAFMQEFFGYMEKEFDIETMLRDLSKYYQAHRVQLISVV